MRKTLVVLTLLGLALVPVAGAHVEQSPDKVPAGSTSRITLSVEGEESVPAVKLTVQMPLGVDDVLLTAPPGWKAAAKGRVVTWTGGQIPHGAVGKFSFSARMPDTPGRVLVFPSLVTYQDGNVVHWIGTESSDTPAPRVTLTLSQRTNPPPAAPTTASSSTEGDGGSKTWIWIAIAAALFIASVATVLLVQRRHA